MYSIKDTDIMLATAPMQPFTLQDTRLFAIPEKRYDAGRVRDLPSGEKPREKLLAQGPEALSSPELLSIILMTGTKREELGTMTERIFKEYGDRSIINVTDATELAKELDIPQVKACQIVATMALGKRFFKKTSRGTVTIRTPKDVFNYVTDMRDLPKEHLRGLYLNSRYQVIHDEVVSVGTLTSSLVHPREVFKPALDYAATAVVIAHNHPSGELEPSPEDIAMTEQLIAASRILGIPFLDHVIITKDTYMSVPARYEN